MSARTLILLSFIILGFRTTAQAFLGFGDTKVKVSYPCLGLDGVPIADATLAGQCCDSSGNLNANASDSCRTSLYGAGVSEATTGVATSFTVAQSTMDVARQLNGDGTDYSGSAADANAVSKPTPSSSSVTSSALSAGATSGLGTGSTGAGVFGNNSGLGSGTGSGGNGSGSGSGSSSGIGSGVGTAGSTAGKKSDEGTNDPKAADAGGAYAAVNGDGAGGAGKDGKVGGLYGSLFGRGGSGVGADGFGDAKFGDGSGAEGKGGKDGKGKDGDEFGGTTEDPADYFNRIDRSASIFKVVSKRYSKETERKHILVPPVTH